MRKLKGSTLSTTASATEHKKNILNAYNELASSDKADLLSKMGLGESFNYCPMCDKVKSKSKFFKNYDKKLKSSLSNICEDCALKVCYPDGRRCNRETLTEALKYLNRPMLYNIYDDVSLAVSSAPALEKKEYLLFREYLEKINGSVLYQKMDYSNSDNLKVHEAPKTKREVSQEAQDRYYRNRKDVVRILGYDPFKDYPSEDEKPLLYAQFVNFVDEEAKDDGMKLAAIVQIVKKLNQAEILNRHIENLILDNSTIDDIQKMESTSKQIIDIVNNLAKDNGISVNHNNNKSKGAHTLSGKMKMLEEIGYREAKVNTFDVGTCKGMEQVAEISMKAILNQIGNDESVLSETLQANLKRLSELEKEYKDIHEKYRLLLVENSDLKEYIKEVGVPNE